MTATAMQVRIMMREHQKGCTQAQAAASANLRSRQTAAKYLQAGGVPATPPPPRDYSTRPDPFAADWAEVETMLTQSPTLDVFVKRKGKRLMGEKGNSFKVRLSD